MGEHKDNQAGSTAPENGHQGGMGHHEMLFLLLLGTGHADRCDVVGALD